MGINRWFIFVSQLSCYLQLHISRKFGDQQYRKHGSIWGRLSYCYDAQHFMTVGSCRVCYHNWKKSFAHQTYFYSGIAPYDYHFFCVISKLYWLFWMSCANFYLTLTTICMKNSSFFQHFSLILYGRRYSMHSKDMFFSFIHIKHDCNSTECENCYKFESCIAIYGISMRILNKHKFLLKWRCSPPYFFIHSPYYDVQATHLSYKNIKL